MNRLRLSSFFSLANGREKNAFSFVCVNGDTRLHILARALCVADGSHRLITGAKVERLLTLYK